MGANIRDGATVRHLLATLFVCLPGTALFFAQGFVGLLGMTVKQPGIKVDEVNSIHREDDIVN